MSVTCRLETMMTEASRGAPCPANRTDNRSVSWWLAERPQAERAYGAPATNGAICQGNTGSGSLRDGGSHEAPESSRLANCLLSVRHAVISDR